MATQTDDSTPADPPAATVRTVTNPTPEVMRLNCNIPTALSEWLDRECDARMVGKALLVTKALELLRDELPPAP